MFMENFASSSPETLPTIEDKIKNVTSFDELYAILDELNEIKGESGVYKNFEVHKKIEQVRHGHRDVGYVTRALGLRDKVGQLLPDDKIFKKYNEKQNN